MDFIIIVGAALLIVVSLVVWLTRYYHRVPPNQVMVVYGRKVPRLITNGGVFVIPILEEYKKLDLTIITITKRKDEVYTVSGVPIMLDWVAQVQVGHTDEALNTAARAFLDKTRPEITQVILDTLSVNFRAIVGQMSVEAIHRDRDEFVQRVQDLASDDVSAMGVMIVSMGIEEIVDNQGYLEAMAAPQIAAVKRDARIAEAEAEREARVRAATATRESEQAELDAQRETLAQSEAFKLREVEVQRRVDLENAAADQEVQQRRALAVEQRQEAEVLVPARAERQAVEIRAEADRRRVTINAQAEAAAIRERAEADAAAVEQRGKAEASAFQAQRIAEAEGEKAKLLAEAQGRRELASATAAEDSINLRQYIIERVTEAEVDKVRAISDAIAGLGGNVRMVQLSGGGNGNGSGHGSFMDFLLGIPEVAEVFRTKVEALSGDDFDKTVTKVLEMFRSMRQIDEDVQKTAAVPIEVEVNASAQEPAASGTSAVDASANAPTEGSNGKPRRRSKPAPPPSDDADDADANDL